MNKKIIKLNIYKFIILMYICMLYSFYEMRIFVEAALFYFLGFYAITRKKFPTKYILWNCMFISMCMISLLWSKDIKQSIIQTRIMVECAIVGNLIISFIDDKNKMLFIYNSFVIAGISLLIRLIITVPMSTWGSGRIATEALNSNTIGMYLAISILFAIQLIKCTNNKKYIFIVITFSIVILLTGSRKAFFMLLAGMFILYYLNSSKISYKLMIILIMSIMIIISYNLIMDIPDLYNVLGIRIEEMINTFTGRGSIDYSTRERLSMIKVGMQLFKENPLIGYGIGSYSEISGFWKYAHNNYIELLVGVGLIGTIIYYSIYVYIVIKLLFKRKEYEFNVLIALVPIVLIMDFALVSYSDEVYQLLIAISMAAISINTYINKSIISV